MIDGFRGYTFYFLLTILQIVSFPIEVVAVADIPIGVSVADSTENPALNQSLAESPETQPSLLAFEELSETPLVKSGETARERGGDFEVPETKNLEGLIGAPEITVSADVEGLFIDVMSENSIFEEEPASQVTMTNLEESINTGRSYNRQSRAALASLEQAKSQTRQSIGLLLPNVSLRANRGYEISEPSVVVDPVSGDLLPHSKHVRTDLSLTATQPLFDLSTFLEWRRRRVKEQAREESYRMSDGDAFIATVRIYLSLVSSRLQADVTFDFEAQLEELLHYIEKRADAGAASVSDMSRVRARRQATRSSRLEQESAHLAAGTEFVRLTNLVPRKVRLPKVEDIGSTVLPDTFEEAVVKAMQSNPEISTLTAELRAEKIDRLAVESRFLPRLDAEYTDTYSNHAGGSADSQRDQRFMLVMNWNIFSGGRDLNVLAERKARYTELRYRLDDERRRVVQALASDYAALETTRERIVSGYEELESIATAAKAMSKRMLSGNQSLLDLLDFYDRYFQVRSRLINLHVLEMITAAQLIRLTMGTPWPSAFEL